MKKTETRRLSIYTHKVLSNKIEDDEEVEPISPASSTMSSASLLDPIETAAGLENLFDVFVYVNGRRYLKDSSAKCYLPCDEQEAYRNYKKDCIFKFIWKGHYSAPVLDDLTFGAKVLDVGCGSGAWVINMSSEYQLSTFIGIDIAPAFPESVPGNAAFLQCNALDGLPFPDNTFDFVRQGFLVVSMDWEEWKDKVVKELIRVTRPGGYIEVMELDIVYHRPSPICEHLQGCMTSHLEKIGINTKSSGDVVKAFREFGDKVTVAPVEEKIHPLGGWAGKLGELSMQANLEAYESLQSIICPVLGGLSRDEFRQLLADYAIQCNRYKTYKKTYRITVRKN